MSTGFVPNITGDFAGGVSGPPGPGAPPPPEVTRRRVPELGEVTMSVFSNLEPISLAPSKSISLNAVVSIPSDATPPVGSVIMMRTEYWHDGVLAEFGPAACSYIAHPLPPLDCGPRPVLIFCHGGFSERDYRELAKFFNVFKMKAAFLDYGHYSTPVKGKEVLNIDDKWTPYLGTSTIICCNNRIVTQRFDQAAMLRRLAAHVSQGGALISTPDFKTDTSAGNTRCIQTNMAPFGLTPADSITSSAVGGTIYTEMTMALVSTRTVSELLDWLKNGGPPLNMAIQSQGSKQRFRYQEEFIEAKCCSCVFGDSWRPGSVHPDRTSPYTVQDAVYEALALYVEEDLRAFGGPERFILDYVVMKHDNRQPPANFPPLGPRTTRLVNIARSDAALSQHLLAVLWALFPLNLDLQLRRNPARPQKFGRGRFYGEQEVVLNPHAQTFWQSLKNLMPGSLDQHGGVWAVGEAIKTASSMRQFRESLYGSDGWVSLAAPAASVPASAPTLPAPAPSLPAPTTQPAAATEGPAIMQGGASSAVEGASPGGPGVSVRVRELEG
jgi:hypothetical protein